MAQQKAKRATARWLVGAPEYVLACYCHPQFADCYTVVYGGPMQERTHGRDWLHGLSTSENGGASGSFEFKLHEFSAYRRANHHRLIRWCDLPQAVRLRARYWADDGKGRELTASEVIAIGEHENRITLDTAEALAKAATMAAA